MITDLKIIKTPHVPITKSVISIVLIAGADPEFPQAGRGWEEAVTSSDTLCIYLIIIIYHIINILY